MVTGFPQFNTDTQRQTVDLIAATPNSPLLTTMSMIAPSPDWFTGLSGFDMRNLKTNTWYQSISIETFPYDAGTDVGATYAAADVPAPQPVPIFRLTADTLPPKALLNAAGTAVLPVARWQCNLVTSNP